MRITHEWQKESHACLVDWILMFRYCPLPIALGYIKVQLRKFLISHRFNDVEDEEERWIRKSFQIFSIYVQLRNFMQCNGDIQKGRLQPPVKGQQLLNKLSLLRNKNDNAS